MVNYGLDSTRGGGGGDGERCGGTPWALGSEGELEGTGCIMSISEFNHEWLQVL